MKITKFNNFRMLNKVKKIIKLINGHRYMFLKKQVQKQAKNFKQKKVNF